MNKRKNKQSREKTEQRERKKERVLDSEKLYKLIHSLLSS
jgi:hypothetical protein